jgi:hypothetical protein
MKTKHGIRVLRNKGLYLEIMPTIELWEIFWSPEVPEKD